MWFAHILRRCDGCVALAFLSLIRLYQLTIRPILGANCRFTPHCSQYAIEAIRHHGAAHGAMLAAWRIVRCNPFCACGHDPVPRANEMI